MKISFNRIVLFSENVDNLKNFYQQHFEFTLVEEIRDEWVVLQAGNTEIAFHRIGVEYRSTTDLTNSIF